MQAEKNTSEQKIRHKYLEIRKIIEQKFSAESTLNHRRVAELLNLAPGATKRWQTQGKYTPEEAQALKVGAGISRDWVLFDEGTPLDLDREAIIARQQAEIERLRNENAALKAELSLLKKA